MKEKIAKTNVARLLDKAKIAYELIPYEVDENDLSAVHVAAKFGREHRTSLQDFWCFMGINQDILSVSYPASTR